MVNESMDMLKTGGVKYDEGKLRTDLIPIEPLLEVARVYTIGCKKYADRNWEKGILWTRCYGALLRHLWQWFKGEKYDSNDGQHHLAAVVFYAFALMEFENTHAELDDRPKQKATENPVANKYPIYSPEYIRGLQNEYGSERPITGGKIGYENGADAPCGHRKCKVSYRNPTGECLVQKSWAQASPNYSSQTPSVPDGTGFSG